MSRLEDLKPSAAVKGTDRVHVRRPFQREPDFGVMSVIDDFVELLARAEAPR